MESTDFGSGFGENAGPAEQAQRYAEEIREEAKNIQHPSSIIQQPAPINRIGISATSNLQINPKIQTPLATTSIVLVGMNGPRLWRSPAAAANCSQDIQTNKRSNPLLNSNALRLGS